MKKGICLFLSGILLLTLTACGGGNNAPTAEKEPPSSTESSVSAGVNVPAVPAEEPFWRKREKIPWRQEQTPRLRKANLPQRLVGMQREKIKFPERIFLPVKVMHPWRKVRLLKR